MDFPFRAWSPKLADAMVWLALASLLLVVGTFGASWRGFDQWKFAGLALGAALVAGALYRYPNLTAAAALLAGGSIGVLWRTIAGSQAGWIGAAALAGGAAAGLFAIFGPADGLI